MPTCFALFCNHDSRRESCRMYQFPSDAELKKQWLNSTRRTDVQLKASSRICSCHFTKGKKHYGPTLFAWTNYISKIRRDLDCPKIETNPPNKEPTGISTVASLQPDVPHVQNDVKTEVDELAENENSMEMTSQYLENFENYPKIDIKDIESKVNNNHKLVKLRIENLILAHEIDELEKQLREYSDNESYQFERLTVQKLMHDQILLHYYTGLPSYSVFKFLIYAVSEYQLKYNKWSVINLHLDEQLLITLMKIRCNFGFSDIGFRFRVSSSTVKNIIWTFVEGLHSIFYDESIHKRSFPCFIDNASSLPEEFSTFSNCRIILGSVEVETEASRHSMASDYKQRTLRGLVGVSPLGDFIFASDLFPDNVSLRTIILKSRLLEKLSPGDLILSLEYLDIEDILPSGVDVNVPLLIHNDITLDEKKIIANISCATAGLDRAIERLRRFAVLDRILLPYRNNASKIFQLCSALVNLESSVVEEN